MQYSKIWLYVFPMYRVSFGISHYGLEILGMGLLCCMIVLIVVADDEELRLLQLTYQLAKLTLPNLRSK